MPQLSLVIEGRRVEAERLYLRSRQLCFPLQMTLREVRNALRRGDIPDDGRRRVDVGELSQLLEAEGDLLPIRFLEGWAQGRFEMPEPAALDESPPSLESRLELLDLALDRA